MWGLGGQLNALGLLLPASDLQVGGSCAGTWLPVTVPISPCRRQPRWISAGPGSGRRFWYGEHWLWAMLMCGLNLQYVTEPKGVFLAFLRAVSRGLVQECVSSSETLGEFERTLTFSKAWKCYELFLWLKSKDAQRGIKWWRTELQGRTECRC